MYVFKNKINKTDESRFRLSKKSAYSRTFLNGDGKIEEGDENAGTRKNGPGYGRVRGHRPTCAERAFAAEGRCGSGLHALI